MCFLLLGLSERHRILHNPVFSTSTGAVGVGVLHPVLLSNHYGDNSQHRAGLPDFQSSRCGPGSRFRLYYVGISRLDGYRTYRRLVLGGSMLGIVSLSGQSLG